MNRHSTVLMSNFNQSTKLRHLTLLVQCSRAKPVGPGFESRGVRVRGCALPRSPILGRNGRPVLPGFPLRS
ncbi:unnamed protein product, partial [Schistosoma margrebowiei]